MAQKETTPQHCPGYANFKTLKSFTCNCPKCGTEKEIFSDEFDRPTSAANAETRLTLRSASSRARARASLRVEHLYDLCQGGCGSLAGRIAAGLTRRPAQGNR